MSNFNTVTRTNESEGSDLYLLGRGTTSRTQTREILAAAIANSRWSNLAKYLKDSKIVASNGKEYKAVVDNGVGTAAGVVDPITGNENIWILIEEDILANILKLDAGEVVPLVSTVIPSHLVKADGQLLSRTTDNYLWDIAQNSGLLISQADKDAHPTDNAMKWGDGDGSTTFSIPNLHLGEFLRGAPSGVNIGEVQVDTIREMTGFASLNGPTGRGYLANEASGVFSPESVGQGKIITEVGMTQYTGNIGLKFQASNQVPVSSEVRPHTGNILMCIHRGKV